MSVQQAAKVLELLEFYARTRQPASLAEISQAMGWPRSSTFSLLQALAERGFLYEPRVRAGYYPSPRWLSLIQKVADAEPLPETLHTIVHELSLETGETVALGGSAGTSAIFLAVRESPAAIRYFAQVGHRLPIHASATGRALLGQYGRDERMALYRRVTFQQHSPSTPISIEAVETELRRAAERGWHESRGDFSPDLVGVGIPLPVGERRLSLVVAGPSFRLLGRIPATAAAIRQVVAHYADDLGDKAPEGRTLHRSLGRQG
jgi:IclR family acetate operon transcriptional repressor